MLYANLFTAYGMLISFTIQGYATWSISFSTLSIFTSYAFTVVYWKDLNSLPKNVSRLWFKAALFFNVISSLGVFLLAFMMATKMVHQNWYLASVYFFLHFQYNGWFFFACMGLLVARIEHIVFIPKQLTLIFWLFFYGLYSSLSVISIVVTNSGRYVLDSITVCLCTGYRLAHVYLFIWP